jgi:hypothetical protein
MSVVHQVRGRLRVRVPPPGRTDGLVDAVLAQPGVRAASWSPRTRGLLVIHDDADVADVVESIASHAGVALVVPRGPAAGIPRPTLASAVTSVVGDVDARVTRASGGLLTLRSLLPLALTVWAAGEVLRGRAAPLAWSSALWYAHGLFRDYSLSPRDD